MGKNKNWTPEEIKDKEAEKRQFQLYGAGAVSGAISWMCFENNSPDPGGWFALGAVIAFAIGSLIKTTYRKKAQANVYVKDPKTESLRQKFLGAGVVSGIIAFIAFANDGVDAGVFFGLGSVGALLVAGFIPVKWIKGGEVGGYRK